MTVDRKTASRWHYAGTLLPADDELAGVDQVEIHIAPELPEELPPKLPHRTPINVHEFKPRYYRSPQRPGVVSCYVASGLVCRHTLAGWRLREQLLGPGPKVTCVSDDVPTERHYRKLAGEMVSSLKVARTVLFAKHESFLTYLRRRELARLGVPESTLRPLVSQLERIRYGLCPAAEPGSVYRQHLPAGLVEAVWRRFPEDLAHGGSFLRGQSLSVDGCDVTVVNLPWGQDLAQILAEVVVEAGAERLYVVGGVAYLGDEADLDDLFVPTALGERGCAVPGAFEAASTVAGPAGKRVATGRLHCVTSSFDNPPNFAAMMRSQGIHALDMESAGFRQVADELGGSLAIVNYIMDVPLRGISLSDTYYNRSYLEQLIASPNRGRDACFEAVVAAMTGAPR